MEKSFANARLTNWLNLSLLVMSDSQSMRAWKSAIHLSHTLVVSFSLVSIDSPRLQIFFRWQLFKAEGRQDVVRLSFSRRR